MTSQCRVIQQNVKNRHFLFHDTARFYVLLNNSVTSGRTEFHNSSFESARCDESNRTKIIFLRCFDAELFDKM